MSKGDNYFKRPDGVTEIYPVYPENISHHFPLPYNPQVDHDVPFTTSPRESLFCIRDSITICNPSENNIIEGILVFEIRPESWTMIYVPTEKLRGFYYVEDDDGTKLDEFDYIWTPIERIHGDFSHCVLGIMQACVDYIDKNPDLSADVVESIVETIQELRQSSTVDFKVDIYIPPRICDLTGEVYLRPGGKLYSIFDNPHRDADFEPPRQLKEFLTDVITNDIPAQGLTLSCDLYFPIENRMLEEARAREDRQKLLAVKLGELSKVFKIYQYPPVDTRVSMREPILAQIPNNRLPIRPSIIPKHSKNNI